LGAVDHGEQHSSIPEFALVFSLLVLLYFLFVSNCSKPYPKQTYINISMLCFKVSQKTNMFR
jgi:hypothetical protein